MNKKAWVSILSAAVLGVSALLGGCGGATPPVREPMDDPTNDNYRVFYQIFVGSFSDSDGDGIGDLRGIINRMDYLNDGNMNSSTSLGVQGIWLSPIFASPTYHKYDATDYYEIDSAFGTRADLEELIDLCHDRNVKIILDLAINHTARDSEWFTEFAEAHRNGDTDNKYYDYYSYVAENEREGGVGYAAIPSTNEYYECNFDSGMPELNYDNDAVREEMVDVARYYLGLGIDGFRFDAIRYIYYTSTQKSVEFWEWYMDELREIKPDIYTVGECWGNGDAEMLNYYGATDCFSFDGAGAEGKIASAAAFGDIVQFVKYVDKLTDNIKAKNPDGMYRPFIANHDTDRAAGYLSVSAHKMQMAANLYLLCTGSPVIYYGEEIGMYGSRGSANSDANRRLAMLWGDNDTVKDPDGATYKSSLQTNGTVASQIGKSNSLLSYYREVIRLRKLYPEIARGDYTAVTLNRSCAGFIIDYNGEKTVLIHNVSTDSVSVDISSLPAKKVADRIGFGNAAVSGSALKLGPQTSVILK